MAARVLFQRRAVAPLAALAIGGLALAPATAFAEAPVGPKRKPIYDDASKLPPTNPAPPSSPQPPADALPSRPAEGHERPRGPTPTDRLAVQIGHARLLLYRQALAAETKLNETMDSAFNLEQSFTNTIASLAPPRESGEKLMPGGIYVLVASMAGSILTRNRNVLLRATGPVALGIGAGWLVLPITMRNVSEMAWGYEQRFPALAASHAKVRGALEKSMRFARVHRDLGVHYVDEKVTDAREAVEAWVKKGN